MQEHTGVAKDMAYLVIFRHDWKSFEEVVKVWSTEKTELEPEPEDPGKWVTLWCPREGLRKKRLKGGRRLRRRTTLMCKGPITQTWLGQWRLIASFQPGPSVQPGTLCGRAEK